jgi:hypothetical protein
LLPRDTVAIPLEGRNVSEGKRDYLRGRMPKVWPANIVPLRLANVA